MEFLRYVGGLFTACSNCGCCGSSCCKQQATPRIQPESLPRLTRPVPDRDAGDAPRRLTQMDAKHMSAEKRAADAWLARGTWLEEDESLRIACRMKPLVVETDASPLTTRATSEMASFVVWGAREALDRKDLEALAGLARQVFKVLDGEARGALLERLFEVLPARPLPREVLDALWDGLLTAVPSAVSRSGQRNRRGKELDQELVRQLVTCALDDPASQANTLLDSLHGFSTRLRPQDIAVVVRCLLDPQRLAPPKTLEGGQGLALAERRRSLCEQALTTAFWRCHGWFETDRTATPLVHRSVAVIEPAPVVRVLTAWLGGAMLSSSDRDLFLDGLLAASLGVGRSGIRSSLGMDPLLAAFEAFLDQVARHSGPEAAHGGAHAEADFHRRIGHVAAVLARLLVRAGHRPGAPVPEAVREEAVCMGIPEKFLQRGMPLALQSLASVKPYLADKPPIPSQGAHSQKPERKSSSREPSGQNASIQTFDLDAPAMLGPRNLLSSLKATSAAEDGT